MARFKPDQSIISNYTHAVFQYKTGRVVNGVNEYVPVSFQNDLEDITFKYTNMTIASFDPTKPAEASGAYNSYVLSYDANIQQDISNNKLDFFQFMNHVANFLHVGSKLIPNRSEIPTKVSQLNNDSKFINSIVTGTTDNGTIDVSDGSNVTHVFVKGLKSAAYTESSAYAPKIHEHDFSTIVISDNYNKGTDSTAIAAGDSVAEAFGKLENRSYLLIEDKGVVYADGALIWGTNRGSNTKVNIELSVYKNNVAVQGWNAWICDKLTTFKPSGSYHAVGLVPAPPAIAGNTKFLREDGIWVETPDKSTAVYNTLHDEISRVKNVVEGAKDEFKVTRYLDDTSIWGTNIGSNTKVNFNYWVSSDKTDKTDDWKIWAVPLIETFGPSGPGASSGLVPAPSKNAASSKFLREDGIWSELPDVVTGKLVSLRNDINRIEDRLNTTTVIKGSITTFEDGTSIWGTVIDEESSRKVRVEVEISSDIFGANKKTSLWAVEEPIDVFIPSGPNAAKGLVPAPSKTAGNTKFLREDGSWSNLPAYPTQHVVDTVPQLNKAYITGTSVATANTGLLLFNTGVYLTGRYGELAATEFTGELNGNAATATKASTVEYSDVTDKMGDIGEFSLAAYKSNTDTIAAIKRLKLWCNRTVTSNDDKLILGIGSASSGHSGQVNVFNSNGKKVEITGSSSIDKNYSVSLPEADGKLVAADVGTTGVGSNKKFVYIKDTGEVAASTFEIWVTTES